MTTELEGLQAQRKDAEAFIERRDMALRLAENPDFKKLIMRDFCVEECARYAQSSQDPALSADARADSLNIAQAAGHFRRWLSVTVQKGNHSASQLEGIDSAIDELRAGGAE